MIQPISHILKFTGVSGASLSPTVMLILGLSTLIADALSMSVSDYVSSTADDELQMMERTSLAQLSEQRLRALLEEVYTSRGQKKTLNLFFIGIGYKKEAVTQLVTLLSQEKATVIDTILMHQEAQQSQSSSPFTSAIFTFASFTFFGMIVNDSLNSLGSHVISSEHFAHFPLLLMLCLSV